VDAGRCRGRVDGQGTRVRGDGVVVQRAGAVVGQGGRDGVAADRTGNGGGGGVAGRYRVAVLDADDRAGERRGCHALLARRARWSSGEAPAGVTVPVSGAALMVSVPLTRLPAGKS